jgi:hypothetical protein
MVSVSRVKQFMYNSIELWRWFLWDRSTPCSSGRKMRNRSSWIRKSTENCTEVCVCVYIVTITGDYRRGFGFIDQFNTRLVTTLNYSAIAKLDTLRIITVHAKSFTSVVFSVILWIRLLTMDVLQPLCWLHQLQTCLQFSLNWLCCNWDWIWIKSYITTDGQSASLFWNKAPIWGFQPGLYYC